MTTDTLELTLPGNSWMDIAGLIPRMLHQVRRRAARSRIASRPRPDAVLFVCRANLCRSPYAAAALRSALARSGCKGVVVDSAGFLTETRDVPANVVTAAGRRGVNLKGHRSAAVSRSHLKDAGLIVVVEPGQVRLLRVCFGKSEVPVLVLGDLDPLAARERTIHDPMTRPGCSFDEAYERVDRCVGELARLLSAAHSG